MIKRKREIELDLLRLFALLAVISVHTTGIGNTDSLSTLNINRLILIFFDTIVTWQIPVYVMISGRFFLDPTKHVDARKISKAIIRLVLAFLFWNVIYQIYYLLTNAYSGLNWKGIIFEVLLGPYHFWYIYMIIFLYAITPFLRQITKDRKLMEYFIILFFIFESLYGYGTTLPFIGNLINQILTKINFKFAMGYSGYYVLGYYLHAYGKDISKKKEYGLYVLGIILMVFVSFISIRKSILVGSYDEWFTDYLKPNIIIVASSIYLFFENRISRFHFSDTIYQIIRKLSELSFGVYLVHALILEILDSLGVSVVFINPIIMLPLTVFFVFMLSIVAVLLVRKIPIIGKRIV